MNCFARARSTLYTLMLGAAIALPGLQAAHLAGPPVARASSVRLPALEGYWRNLDPQTRNITRLHIYYSARDGGERVAVWGKCHPTDCFWGAVPAVPFSFLQATATYHLGFANKYLAIWLSNPDLKVKTHVDFIDGSGRAGYDTYDAFAFDHAG